MRDYYSLIPWDCISVSELKNNHKNIYWEDNEYKIYQNIHIVLEDRQYCLYVPDTFDLNWIKAETLPKMFVDILAAINYGLFKNHIHTTFIFGVYTEQHNEYGYLPIKEHKEIKKEDGSIEIHVEDVPDLVGKLFIGWESSYRYDTLTNDVLSILKGKNIYESSRHEDIIIVSMLENMNEEITLTDIKRLLDFKETLTGLEKEYSEFQATNLKRFMEENAYKLVGCV